MSDFLKRLEESLSKWDVSVHNSIWVKEDKVGKKVLRESGEPLEGIYYWVPRLDGSWSMWSFPFKLYGDVDHEKAWRNYIAPKVAVEFNVKRGDIVDLFMSVPRGRVMRQDSSLPIVFHGDDSPGDIDKVRSEFNLPVDCVLKYWSHETMFLDDYVKLCEVIGRDLGLKPLPEDKRWEREDE